MFGLEGRFDLVFDGLEVGVRNLAQLLVRVQTQVATQTKSLGATDTEQGGERKLQETRRSSNGGGRHRAERIVSAEMASALAPLCAGAARGCAAAPFRC